MITVSKNKVDDGGAILRENIKLSHFSVDRRPTVMHNKIQAFAKQRQIAYLSKSNTSRAAQLTQKAAQTLNVMATQLTFDAVFISIGQRPNVRNLGLERAGVKYTLDNGVTVNDYLQTTNPDVYAAGDCCTKYKFTHMKFDDFFLLSLSLRKVAENLMFARC